MHLKYGIFNRALLWGSTVRYDQKYHKCGAMLNKGCRENMKFRFMGNNFFISPEATNGKPGLGQLLSVRWVSFATKHP